LTVNIIGTGDVNFYKISNSLLWGNAADQALLPNKPSGDNQNRLLWNIVGTGRTINAGGAAPAGVLLAPTGILNHPGGVWKGTIIVGSVVASNQVNRLVCPEHPLPPNPPPSSHVCPYYENTCAGFGFNFPQRNTIVSFRDFNVVAFGSFYDHGGDVEGRLAVGGNADLDNFAVGLEIHSINGPDNVLPYALVVAGDATWGQGGGQVWPTGDSNIDKWPAVREDIFVGGTFNAPQYLLERRTGQCQSDQPGCLNTWFTNAKACYEGISSSFATQPANVDVSTQFTNGLLLSCHDATATQYVANVDSAALNGITWYFLDGCNFHSEWVINVVGTGNVVITGGSFPAVAGGVVYNVVGSGRYIEVKSTGLAGHLLAPDNDLNQTSSVIVGKVVVRNYLFANQVNKPCPSNLNTPVTVPSVVTDTPVYSKRQSSYNTFTATKDVFIVGDVVHTDAGVTTIVAREGNVYTVNPPLTSPLAVGSVVYTVVTDTNAPREAYVAPTPSTSAQDNAASGVTVFFALVALLLVLF
jgi:choice-of-anchor A domain-containing protein